MFASTSDKKRKPVAVAAALALVLALAGCSPAGQGQETSEPEVHEISLAVAAEGWDKGASTPVIVHIKSKADPEAVDLYHAMPANEPHAVELAEGAYEVSYISPINSDGSIYRVPEEPAIAEVSSDGAPAEAELERIPAEEVTQEQLDAVMDQIKDAAAKGDDTLSDDAAQELIDRAAANAAANPNADAGKIAEKREEAKEEAGKDESNKPSAGSSESKPSSSGNSGIPPSSGNQTPPTQPAHQHSWAPQYATVHHDAVTEQVWVPDYVRVGVYECRACGFTTTDHGVIQEHCTAIYGAHPETGSNYGSNYQMVESGGHYETNVISAAWDEQVVSGYACPCGATK